MFTNHICLKHLYKPDFALNNLKLLIYHKTKPNLIMPIIPYKTKIVKCRRFKL